MAGDAGDAAAGMGARAAQIKARQWHAIVGMAEHRPVREELVQAHLAVEDVAAGQAEAAFKIERRQSHPAGHRSGEAGGIAVDLRDDRVGRLVAARVPAARHIIREMLAEQAGDMGAGRGEAVVQG